NTDGAVIYGVSIAGRYNFIGDFWMRGAATWTDGETDNGEPVRHVSPVFADVHILYSTSKWKIDAFMRYNGMFKYEDLSPSEQDKAYLYTLDEAGLPYVPSWYTINVSASYSINNFLISAGVENIMDVLYRPYSSGISAAGRNVFGGIRYNF